MLYGWKFTSLKDQQNIHKNFSSQDSSSLRLRILALCWRNCSSWARLAARASSSSTWTGNHSGNLNQDPLSFEFSISWYIVLVWSLKAFFNFKKVKSAVVPTTAKATEYRIAPSWPPKISQMKSIFRACNRASITTDQIWARIITFTLPSNNAFVKI